jgi:hypothetical protein
MTTRFPGSKSAIILDFVSKVVTILDLLAFVIDCADMATDFIVKINKEGKTVSTLLSSETKRTGVGTLKRAARLHAL